MVKCFDLAAFPVAYLHFMMSLLLILQGVGLFTPNWVSTDACHSTGIIYSCCYGEENSTCAKTEGDGLDVRALGLHCAAFALMLVATLYVNFVCWQSNPGKDGSCAGSDADCGDGELIIGTSCLLFFPVSGLLSFAGCMLIASKYSASELGYSFVLCLISACLLLIATIYIISLGIVYFRAMITMAKNET